MLALLTMLSSLSVYNIPDYIIDADDFICGTYLYIHTCVCQIFCIYGINLQFW